MAEPFDAKALAEEILDPFTLEWEEAAAVRDAIAAALTRVRAQAIEEAAETAIKTWKEAPNERPEYRQNICLAAAAAIRSLAATAK